MDWNSSHLLLSGKTSHVTFKLPLNITEDTTCNITPNSENGKILQNIQVIIWDEITITSKHAFEAVDRLFRYLCRNNIIVGGKVMIVSGDFR